MKPGTAKAASAAINKAIKTTKLCTVLLRLVLEPTETTPGTTLNGLYREIRRGVNSAGREGATLDATFPPLGHLMHNEGEKLEMDFLAAVP
jgi:hypothetical protein